ncbi:hypothetical protein EJB05_42239, partial [Eragrostis curvula]
MAPEQAGTAAAPPPCSEDARGFAVVPHQGAPAVEAPPSPEGPPGFWVPPSEGGTPVVAAPQAAPAKAPPLQNFAPVMAPGSLQGPPPMPDQSASMGVTVPMPLQCPAMATQQQPPQCMAPPPPLPMGIPHNMMDMQQAQGGHMIAPVMMQQQQPPHASTVMMEQPPQPFSHPPMMQLQQPLQASPVVMQQSSQPFCPPPLMQKQQPPQASTVMMEQPPQPFGHPPMMQLQQPLQASPVVMQQPSQPFCPPPLMQQQPPQVSPVGMEQPPQSFGPPPLMQQQPPQTDPMMMPQPHLSAPPYKRQRFDHYDIFRQYMGFCELRLVQKSAARQPICFVDFATPVQAFVAMGSLQGYKFDRQDHQSPKLRLEFSHSPRVASYGPHRLGTSGLQTPLHCLVDSVSVRMFEHFAASDELWVIAQIKVF